MAAPRIAGWRCENAEPAAYGGLLALPLGPDRTELSCSFRPPGLRAGLAAGAVAVLVLLSRAGLRTFRRRGTASAG